MHSFQIMEAGSNDPLPLSTSVYKMRVPNSSEGGIVSWLKF